MPLSVTRTVMRFVVPASTAVVAQAKAPLVLTIAAAAGAPGSRLKAKVWPGSMSLAGTLKESVWPAVTVWLASVVNTGRVLTVRSASSLATVPAALLTTTEYPPASPYCTLVRV